MDISGILATTTAHSLTDAQASLKAQKTPEAQRKQAAKQFEAILMRQFLSSSVGSMLGGEQSSSGSVYGYMLTDALAQKLTEGNGLGLSKMIESQLSPNTPQTANIPGSITTAASLLAQAPLKPLSITK
jgi:Rod binding domain-containing protein